MDCTHIPWLNCPYNWRNLHIGKEVSHLILLFFLTYNARDIRLERMKLLSIISAKWCTYLEDSVVRQCSPLYLPILLSAHPLLTRWCQVLQMTRRLWSTTRSWTLCRLIRSIPVTSLRWYACCKCYVLEISLRVKLRYSNINFLQLTSTGEERTLSGLSVLTDNGYLKYKQMQCPYKYWSSDKEKEWSKMAESLRLYSIIISICYVSGWY